MIKLCELCKSQFNSRRKSHRFCGKVCSGKYAQTFVRQHKGYDSGHTPWNKGLKGWTEKNGAGFQQGHGYIGGGTPEGMRMSRETEFKKGLVPWNKGTKGLMKTPWNKGLGKANTRDLKSPEYVKWRKEVFVRDNYTCQWCGIRGDKLEADHIFPWAQFEKKRFLISNGRTLCKPCHKKRTSVQLSVYWKNQYATSGLYSGTKAVAGK